MNGSSSSRTHQRLRRSSLGQGSDSEDSGLLNEQILLRVFETIQWDLQALCSVAAVNRKLRAVAKRLLWRELCVFRAPRMLEILTDGLTQSRVNGGWHALAKLLFFCCGCESTTHFRVTRSSPGHFTKETRFSKTSGRSFLTKKFRDDLLFVSDPCEHPTGESDDDLGIYRGVFKGFNKSKTRGFLIRRAVPFEEGLRCPYCGSRVWSMTAARLIPSSAWRRLGSHDGGLEYFVCVNGHLYGTCWLAPLSSEDEDEDEDDDEEEELNGRDEVEGLRFEHRTAVNQSKKSCRFGKDNGEEPSAGRDKIWETA
uniref:EID1-like F-box protein 3 n=1 Tax=Kalanchoe fedtschenkoi TaxID=63787 RepID=A0A7N0TVB0_KALFE